MGPNLTAIDRATAAASEYAAAWGDTVRSFEQGEGYELAAAHMRRAGGQLVALVEGLRELHEQLDRPPVVPSVGQYGPDEVVRIVRAAVAFRRAAPVHKWPYQAWHEMAEICAAVDCKPGPADVGPDLPKCGQCGHWSPHTAGGGCGVEVRATLRGKPHTGRCGCKARNDDQAVPDAG